MGSAGTGRLNVTVLLIDLGNTALKWTTLDKPDEPHTYVHGGSDVVSEALLQEWLSLRPTRVVGCMVSSETLALALTRFFNQHGMAWEWLHSEERFVGDFTLVNRYENSQQLGSDRWYAAVGAAGLYPGEALLVVHMGTATTVDTILPEGDHLAFLGGRILPGPLMMYESLVQGTRCRPEGVVRIESFPLSTDAAISTGILEAHLGVFERALKAVREKGFEARFVFAGGAAPRYASYIQAAYPQAVLKHNMVLRGLALKTLLSGKRAD